MIDSVENRPETAESYDDSSWEKVNAENPQMPLANTVAVFRTQFDLSESDLPQPSISLHFGSIDDLGWIYINGKKAGETNDWSRSWTIDVTKLVKPGWNTVAVVVRNQGNTGGLNSGTRLEIARAAGSWKRNAFNGLAQIIVQSTKNSGEITLRAQSEGLEPDAAALKSKQCPPRPCPNEAGSDLGPRTSDLGPRTSNIKGAFHEIRTPPIPPDGRDGHTR